MIGPVTIVLCLLLLTCLGVNDMFTVEGLTTWFGLVVDDLSPTYYNFTLYACNDYFTLEAWTNSTPPDGSDAFSSSYTSDNLTLPVGFLVNQFEEDEDCYPLFNIYGTGSELGDISHVTVSQAIARVSEGQRASQVSINQYSQGSDNSTNEVALQNQPYAMAMTKLTSHKH